MLSSDYFSHSPFKARGDPLLLFVCLNYHFNAIFSEKILYEISLHCRPVSKGKEGKELGYMQR